MNHDIMLTIGVFSCNHQKWLKALFEGILAQKTNYSYEVIVLDDASQDDSPQIIREYADNNPAVFQVLLNSENRGPLLQAQTFVSMAKGKYMCWLDGDDCWTFEEKIDTQIRFLENKPEYNGCFHDASIVSDQISEDEEDEYAMRFHNHWKSYSQFNTYHPDFFPWDALQRKIIPTASLVFRSAALDGFFDRRSEIRLSISWLAHLWLLKNSKFMYFNEVWSRYNDHADGFSKKYGLIEFKINNIGILEQLLSDNYYSYLKKDLYRAISQEYFHLLSLPNINEITAIDFKKHIKAYEKYLNLMLKSDSDYFRKQYEGKIPS